jgi:hypothetical protein
MILRTSRSSTERTSAGFKSRGRPAQSPTSESPHGREEQQGRLLCETECVPDLSFPADRCVGQLGWPGSYTEENGPVLAQGVVVVPAGVSVAMVTWNVTQSHRNDTGGWFLTGNGHPIDLTFIESLPNGVIDDLRLGFVEAATLPVLTHLAPSLRRLCLARCELGDVALPIVAALSSLQSLQTFGNHFTDEGVQVLRQLASLENLWLEEESLSISALRFVHSLPNLKVLGISEMQVTQHEVEVLRATLDGVLVNQLDASTLAQQRRQLGSNS